MVELMMAGKFEVLISFFFILPTIATGLEFTTEIWTLPNTPPGTPPIKLARVDDSISISCETDDENAVVELFISRSVNSPFEAANEYFKERLKRNGQIFTVESLKAGDHGIYRCETADGKAKIELVKGLLLVKVPMVETVNPKITVNGQFSHDLLKLQRGAKVTIKCESAGSPTENYLSWYRKDKQGNMKNVEDSLIRRYKTEVEGKSMEFAEFTINSFTKEYINVYRCKRIVPRLPETSANIHVVMQGFCYFHGNLYEVQKSFVPITCTSQCTCDTENSFHCVSLCPPHFINCPPGQIEVSVPVERTTSPKCSCNQKRCVNMTDHCYLEDKLYKKGESFISKSCASCKCKGFNSVACVSLCPPSQIKCRSDEVEHFDARVKSENPKCVCKVPTCLKINDICKMKSEQGPCFAIFNRWHFNAASQKCEKFVYGGCDGNPNRFVFKSTCQKMCGKPTKVIGGYSMGSVLGDCQFEGKWYKKGEEYISKYCKQRCTCMASGSVVCKPVCPLMPPKVCPDGTMAVQSAKLVNRKPTCYCPEQKCVSIDEVCQMPPEDGSCYAHIRRWYYNPSLQSCASFIYGGCEGNPNNFASLQSCQEICEKKTKPRGDGFKAFSISGKILFSPRFGTLPTPSCASVKLIDTTSSGGHGTSSTSFVVSKMDISQGIEYQMMTTGDALTSNKTYSLSAVVNVGWCKDLYTFNWVKEGDYISRKASEIIISNEKKNYEKDIDVSSIP